MKKAATDSLALIEDFHTQVFGNAKDGMEWELRVVPLDMHKGRIFHPDPYDASLSHAYN